MSDQVDLVRALYDAFARGNAAGMLGMLDPQVEWNEAEHVTLWPGGPIYGPDQVAAQEQYAERSKKKKKRRTDCLIRRRPA